MITVRDIKKTIIEEKAVISGKIDCKSLGFNDFELWFRFPKELYSQIRLSGNPFVPALVLASMHTGENLHIQAEVSEKLLNGAARNMQIYRMWHNAFQAAKIEPQKTTKTAIPGPNTAMFFSAGVDSFYTLLKNKKAELCDSEKISHLIFVHGFDIPLEKTELFKHISARIANISEAYNKKLLVVSTNIRNLIEHICTWGMYHGAAMASVALCLENFAKKVFIPADLSYRYLLPHGSHPLTDPYWRSESVEIIYDGAEAGRIEKIKLLIAESPVAMNNLRVCFSNTNNGSYNCGECEKCIRTKLNLKAAGVPDKCSTLDKNLDYKKIKKLKLNDYSMTYMLDNYETLRQAGTDKKILRAMKDCLSSWSAHERKRKKQLIEKAIKKKINRFLHINKPEKKGKVICRW